MKDQTPFAIRKFITPKAMIVNDRRSPCECSETTTCAYCVQANLLGYEKEFKKDDAAVTTFIASIRRNGIRQTSRELNVFPSTVRYWIKTKNIPKWVIQKYGGVGQRHT